MTISRLSISSMSSIRNWIIFDGWIASARLLHVFLCPYLIYIDIKWMIRRFHIYISWLNHFLSFFLPVSSESPSTSMMMATPAKIHFLTGCLVFS